jgi:hypothetical protein
MKTRRKLSGTSSDTKWLVWVINLEQGIAARFHDKVNKLFLELYSTKVDPVNPQKGPVHRQHKLPALPAKLPGIKEDGKDENEFVINIHHLRGHARVLSEGAIECTKGFGYQSLHKEAPIAPQPPPEEFPMKVFLRKGPKFINSIGASIQSELNISPIKMRPDSASHKRIKDRDEILIEMFVAREKSKSV